MKFIATLKELLFGNSHSKPVTNQTLTHETREFDFEDIRNKFERQQGNDDSENSEDENEEEKGDQEIEDFSFGEQTSATSCVHHRIRSTGERLNYSNQQNRYGEKVKRLDKRESFKHPTLNNEKAETACTNNQRRIRDDIVENVNDTASYRSDTNSETYEQNRTSGYDSDDETSVKSPTGNSPKEQFRRDDHSRLSIRSQSVPDKLNTGSCYFHYEIKSEHIQLSHGQGSSNIMSISSSDIGDITKRVKDQTDDMQKSYHRIKTKVETKIYRGAEEYLERPNEARVVILKGTDVGVKFTGKMLLHKQIEKNPDREPLYIIEPSELIAVDTKQRSVVLIDDLSGTTSFQKNRLDEFSRKLEKILPSAEKTGTMTIIATMKEFEDEDLSTFINKFRNYIMFANKKEFRPSDDIKRNLVDSFRDQFRGKQLCKVKSKKEADLTTPVEMVTTEKIVSHLSNFGYILTLYNFFSFSFNEGMFFFRKPLQRYVHKIREFADKQAVSFLTLLAVLCYKGCLTRNDIGNLNELKNASGSNDVRFSMPAGLNKHPRKRKQQKRSIESEQETRDFPNRELRVLFEFARKKNIHNLVDLVHKEARKLVGTFLNESNETYTFASKNIENSFVLVCIEQFPGVLDWCDRNFFFNFIRPEYQINQESDETSYLEIDAKHNKITMSFMKRMKTEFLSGQVAQCMRHPVMSFTFFNDFIGYLDERSHETIFRKKKVLPSSVFQITNNGTTHEWSCLVYGIEKQGKDSGDTVTDQILNHDAWKEIRKRKKSKAFATEQEQFAIIHAAGHCRTDTFKHLVQIGVNVPEKALTDAVIAQATEIVTFCMQIKTLPRKFKCQALLEAVKCYAKMGTKISTEKALEIVKTIEKVIDVNYKESNIDSLIHYAAAQKNISVLKILLEERNVLGKDIDVNLVSTDGETALTIASKLGFHVHVEMLLKHGADQRLQENVNMLPIFVACEKGEARIVSILINANPFIVDEVDSNGNTPLAIAVANCHLETTQLLLDQYGNFLKIKNKVGQSALHIASRIGNICVVDKLIKAGLDPLEEDNSFDSALTLSCKAKRPETVRHILNTCKIRVEKAKLNAKLIDCGVRTDDRDIMLLLIELGFDINTVDGMLGTPLFVVIQEHQYDMLQFLLENGANPNISHDGNYPVHVAGLHGDMKAIQILLQFGASLKIQQGITKNTVLHETVADKVKITFIDELLQLPECDDAVLNARNKKGETALHIACWSGNVEAVELLLKAGASPMIFNKMGRLPREVAKIKIKHMHVSVKQTELWNAFCNIDKLFEDPSLYNGLCKNSVVSEV